jgi:phage host-nuclease inhibitor protein Gam
MPKCSLYFLEYNETNREIEREQQLEKKDNVSVMNSVSIYKEMNGFFVEPIFSDRMAG